LLWGASQRNKCDVRIRDGEVERRTDAGAGPPGSPSPKISSVPLTGIRPIRVPEGGTEGLCELTPVGGRVGKSGRGREASCLARPAQIRTCGFAAYGSYLGSNDETPLAVCVPAPVSRLPGSESGTCFAGPHSPRSAPFAPPAPQRMAPPCSPASSLLWRSPTSCLRASPASAPRLPGADHRIAATGHRQDLPSSDTIPLRVMGSSTPAG
jgi:hypothetical protein